MRVSSPGAASDRLATIRLEVERCGSAVLDPDDVQALCPDEESLSAQFLRVAEIARKEEWMVDFSQSGVIRFVSGIESVSASY